MTDSRPDSSSAAAETGPTIEDDGFLRWLLRSDDDPAVLVRDVASTVAIVALVGLLVFGISGTWPPLVAIESGSMEPNMQKGDLVFVVDDERFVGDGSVDGTGVVPLENARESGHEKFGQPGDVIVFLPNGDPTETPVIHRAHFWVEPGENWVATADESIVGDVTCAQVRDCPAPHAGFVTKGDANAGYDQLDDQISTVVKPEWITGKAGFRLPWVGWIRLAVDALFSSTIVPVGFSGSSGALALAV